jgi:hypothetical protein
VHDESVEAQPVAVQVASTEMAIVVAETQLQKRMFPLDIEEHDALDVDEYRLTVIVDVRRLAPGLPPDLWITPVNSKVPKPRSPGHTTSILLYTTVGLIEDAVLARYFPNGTQR